MMRTRLTHLLAALLVATACAGCAQDADDDAGTAAAADASVLVTVATPVRQTFHTTVTAWGSVVGDERRARVTSLAYGGEVAAVEVVPGQVVRRGQVLLRIRPDPAVRSAYRQAGTALELARSDLAHVTELASRQLATQSQLAAARKALADAQAARDAAQAQGGGAEEAPLTAAVDGVVGKLDVHLGERFAAGAPLLDFIPAHALAVTLGIEPEDAPRLRAGMDVQLRGVYGDGPALPGRLRVLGGVQDPATHLIDAKVELSAAAEAAWTAGTAVSAQVRTADFTAWAVPRGAVLDDADGAYLFQVEQGRAKRVAVQVRSPDGQTLGVEGALDPRAPVVALGVYELEDGAAVRTRATTAGAASAGSRP